VVFALGLGILAAQTASIHLIKPDHLTGFDWNGPDPGNKPGSGPFRSNHNWLTRPFPQGIIVAL